MGTSAHPIPDHERLSVRVPMVAGSAADVWAGSETLLLRQAWAASAPEGLAPTRVRLAHDGSSLRVRAELEDADVFSLATADSQKLWELGDVFEMFFCPADSDIYTEMQVAPGNHRLHLRLGPGDAHALRSGRLGIGDLAICPPRFECKTTLVDGGWTLLASIPLREIPGGESPVPGSHWCASFCRYDAFRDGRPPVLSSSSPHSVRDFHRLNEWTTLCF